MPRKATKHAPIQGDKERASTFKRRLDSFLKKANELSILCGIKIAVVIHNPCDGYSMLWPSEDAFTALTEKFLSFPEREMARKMVLQERFLVDEVEGRALQSLKLKQRNDDREVELCMYQIEDDVSFQTLDLKQLSGLYSLADEKLKELQKRSRELEGMSDANTGNEAAVPEILERPLEDNNSCFIGSSSHGLHDNLDASAANAWISSAIRGDRGEVSDVFHQDWSYYFGH